MLGQTSTDKGGSQLGRDIVKRLGDLSMARSEWESVWRDVTKFFMPFSPEFTSTGGTRTPLMHVGQFERVLAAPRAYQRGRELYDSTSVSALDRFAAGIEGLVTPQSSQWHGLTTADPYSLETSQEEAEYFDLLTNYLFAARHAPKANFVLYNGRAIRSVCALGTGVVFVEDALNLDETQPFRYTNIPLAEAYLDVDGYDNHDTLYRALSRSPRALASRFGRDALSARTRQLLDSGSPNDMRPVDFIHAVYPRDGTDRRGTGIRNGAFKSCYVEADTGHVIAESGFYSFPFAIYSWHRTPGQPYAESPCMFALADVKMLQSMARDATRASQQYTDPPLAVPHDGVTNRLNLNPRAVNPGAIDKRGNLLVRPLITAQNPSFAEALMEAKRNGIRDGLYLSVFQALVDNPRMTATEAILRNQEKSDILGPNSARIQQALATLVEREMDILARKGAFRPESPLAPPASLEGRDLRVRYTAPIDRVRRSSELLGMRTVLESAMMLAQIDPSVRHKIDSNSILEQTRVISGAPASMFKSDAEVEAAIAAEQQAMQMQQTLAAAESAGRTMQAAGSAAQGMAQSRATDPEGASRLEALLGATQAPQDEGV